MPYQPISLKGTIIKDAFRLTGHKAGIRALIYWNTYLISGSDDKTIKIWDQKTGNLLKTLYGHTERILCLAIWNGYLVSGSVDTTIKIWDIVTGKCKRTIREINTDVKCLCATDNFLYMGGKDGKIRIWNSRYQYQGCIDAHSDWINDLQIYNKKYLISCSDDKTIKLWEIASNKCIFTLKGHTEGIQKFCTVNSYLASCSNDFNIIIWELRTGNQIKVLRGHCDTVTSICAYESRYLISGDSSSLLIVWDIKNKFKQSFECTLHSEAVYTTIIANNSLYTSSRDGSIVKWPSVQNFPNLIAILNKNISKTSQLIDNSTTETETLIVLHKQIHALSHENEELIDKQLALHEKLKKEYLLNSTLRDEVLNKTQEMTSLRKEAIALRTEVSLKNHLLTKEVDTMQDRVRLFRLNVYKNDVKVDSTYSTVYMGKWKYYNVIIKEFKNYTFTVDANAEWVKPVDVWYSLRHPCILQIYGCCLDRDQSVLHILEYCPASLQQLMQYCQKKHIILPLSQRLQILLQIADTVKYLHEHNIIHGNLHPNNILMSPTLVPKLTDIQLTNVYAHYLHHERNSPFNSPEKHDSCTDYTFADDVYSLGKLLLWLIRNGESLNEDLSDIQLDAVKLMIQRCCKENPKSRISLDLFIDDLQHFKRIADQERAPYHQMTLIYNKDTGCYLY